MGQRSEEHTSELQSQLHLLFPFFFFNNPATTDISPLSLHDALPILRPPVLRPGRLGRLGARDRLDEVRWGRDRKSTRLNSSHSYISYSLFFFLIIRRPPISPLFPYTTLFRSYARRFCGLGALADSVHVTGSMKYDGA